MSDPAAAESQGTELVLVDHAGLGGGTVIAAELVRAWSRKGRRAEAVSLAEVSAAARSVVATGPWVELRASSHLMRVLRLRRHLLRHHDGRSVILAIGEYPGVIALVARAMLRRPRRPVVVIAEHQPHLLEELLSRRGGALSALAARAVRSIRTGSAASICLTIEQLEVLIDRGAVRRERSFVIQNPCRMSAASRSSILARVRRLELADQVRLLAVGSLNAAKGYDILLEALTALPRNFVLSVAGGGDHSALSALATHLGVADRVEWLGPRSDVDTLMDSHDALVLASRYESFGLVVIEGVVRGMPVVATACNPSIPALANRFAGIRLAPPDDARALSMAIEATARASWSVDCLLEAANRCLSEHSLESAADAHLALFSELRLGRLRT